MKMTVPMQRSLSFWIFCLYAIGQVFAQGDVPTNEIIIKDCRKVPCFTKSPTKTIGNPILPPDYPFAFLVNLTNVNQAESGFGNIGAEFRIGFAPKRSYILINQIVADEEYARDNDLNNTTLYEDVSRLYNPRTPYFEMGLRYTNLNFNSLNGISGGRDFTLRYLDIIPLGMRYEFTNRLSLGLAANISLLTQAVRDGREIADLEATGFNRWEPGMNLNLHYGKRGRGPQIGLNYNLRFSYLSETNLRYGITQVSLGWGFGNGKRSRRK
ncbi:MAG: hypothetical protein AAFP02_02930 [Bacteroidota bacterium]